MCAYQHTLLHMVPDCACHANGNTLAVCEPPNLQMNAVLLRLNDLWWYLLALLIHEAEPVDGHTAQMG